MKKILFSFLLAVSCCQCFGQVKISALPQSPTPDTGGYVLGVENSGGVFTNKRYALPLGTLRSIVAGAGLSGGTITTSGTISLPVTGLAGVWGNSTHIPVFTTDLYGRVTNVTSVAISAGTVTSITAGAGLAGGTITGSGTISLPGVGIAGTYGDSAHTLVATVDAKGRVTGFVVKPLATGLINLQQCIDYGSGEAQGVGAIRISDEFEYTRTYMSPTSFYGKEGTTEIFHLTTNSLQVGGMAGLSNGFTLAGASWSVTPRAFRMPDTAGTVAVESMIPQMGSGTAVLGTGTGTVTVSDARCTTSSIITVAYKITSGSLGTNFKVTPSTSSFKIDAINTAGGIVTTDASTVFYIIKYQ